MAKTTSVMSLESSELPQWISVVWKVRDVTPLQVSATVRLHCFVSHWPAFIFYLFIFFSLGEEVRKLSEKSLPTGKSEIGLDGL